MKPIVRRLGAGALALTAGASGAAATDDAALFQPLPAEARDLDGMKWDKRPVLLFAPDATDPAYRRQMAALNARAPELRERDIVVLSDTAPAPGGALRQRFGGAGFRFLLVGKDGGVKMDRDTPVSAEELFATIDRMPMRRAEMD